MNIRRIILALALMAGTAHAQAPAPVPALPDAERRTSYSISGSTCACAVGFQLYGDGTDYGAWVEVWLNGVQIPSQGWAITSPSGPLANLARPITDAVMTFAAPQTGTVQIVGARRPRRTSTFNENLGVPTRNFNQVLNDLTAQNREVWDKINDVTGRAILAPPGETLRVLPPASSRANSAVCFDAGGNIIVCSPSSSGGGSTPVVPTNTISPLTYGVICDGFPHTGNAANFQLALNAAITAGVFVQLPLSTCVMEDFITNGSTLFASTLIQGYGQNSHLNFIGNAGFAFNGPANYYVLQDFTLSCASASTNACLKIYNATLQSSAIGSIIQRIFLQGSGAYGMYFQNLVQASVRNNYLTPSQSTTGVGIAIDNTQTADVGGVSLKDNFIVNVAASPGAFGILLTNVGGTQIIGNFVDGFANNIFSSNTLSSGASTGLQIQNNQLDDFFSSGIALTSAGAGGAEAHVNIGNNVLHAAQTATATQGIVIVEAPGSVRWLNSLTISGNSVSVVNGSSGILVAGANGYSVTGNTIQSDGGTSSTAITLNASGQTCTVVGNAVSGFTTHLNNAATCTAAGNN